MALIPIRTNNDGTLISGSNPDTSVPNFIEILKRRK
jgi:hypothetical protein